MKFNKVNIKFKDQIIKREHHLITVPNKGDILESDGGWPAMMVVLRIVNIHYDIWTLHCLPVEEAMEMLKFGGEMKK